MFKEINKYEGNLLKDEIVANFYEFCNFKLFLQYYAYISWFIDTLEKSLYTRLIYIV